MQSYRQQLLFSSALLVAACDAQQTFAPELITSDSNAVTVDYGTADENNVTYPGDTCYRMYDGLNYSGAWLRMCLNGDDYYGWYLPDVGWHDRMASYWCGQDVEYRFCRNTSDAESWCPGTRGWGGAGNIRVPHSGYTDDADRLYMWKYDPATQAAVTVFTRGDCTDFTGRFYASTNPKTREEYNTQDIRYNFGTDHDIDSVMVPYGYSVELFDNDGLYGSSLVVDGQMWRDEAQQMVCVNLGHDWINRTSSLAVYRTSQGYRAQGEWVAIATLTETVTFTYYEGFQTSHSSEYTSREKYSLSMEMSEGMDLLGVSESFTITQDYEMEIASDTKSSMERDINVGLGSSCSGTSGVGVWQWQVTSHDGTGRAKTGHLACRYGDLANVKPICPWNACSGPGDCSSCKPGWQA